MTTSLRMPRSAPALFATNALIAWAGLALSATLSVGGYYLGTEDLSKPTLIGNVPAGHDQWWERALDWATFFTIWSNATVAIVLTVLWRRPQLVARTDGVGTLWRALRLDSVLMIVITGIVYSLLLAKGGKSGWDLVSDTTLHVVVPLLTLVVWFVAGPRGLLNAKVIGASLVLPLVWAGYALARGAVIGAYPYSFLDVAKNGWGAVLAFIAVIVIVALVLALLLLALDRVLPPRRDHDGDDMSV
jgi:hypothetical protein